MSDCGRCSSYNTESWSTLGTWVPVLLSPKSHHPYYHVMPIVLQGVWTRGQWRRGVWTQRSYGSLRTVSLDLAYYAFTEDVREANVVLSSFAFSSLEYCRFGGKLRLIAELICDCSVHRDDCFSNKSFVRPVAVGRICPRIPITTVFDVLLTLFPLPPISLSSCPFIQTRIVRLTVTSAALPSTMKNCSIVRAFSLSAIAFQTFDETRQLSSEVSSFPTTSMMGSSMIVLIDRVPLLDLLA